MNSTTEKLLAEAVCRLREEFTELLAVYRFGSFGTEYERPGSDLDLVVYAGSSLPVVELWNVAQKLAAAVGRDVDIVDLATASTVMRSQVIRGGERVYCADELACETFENYMYSSYARLNEERREILQDILRRGSVYG